MFLAMDHAGRVYETTALNGLMIHEGRPTESGGFQGVVTGADGLPSLIEYSEGLGAWHPLRTFENPAAAQPFEDVTPGDGSRFYRVRLVEP
jgi:hypothetical protein